MKSILEYLSRVGKSRGFGIQSPWAYNFVRDVIMESQPYYQYEDIDKEYPDERDRKKQKLYFRIWNFVHNRNFSVVSLSKSSVDDIERVALSYGNEGVIIIEDIYRSPENRHKWLEICQKDFIGITFDLYDFGICFMPNDMYKQHYKLNF